MTTVYFDLETGGIAPQHPTIQLAAIAVKDGVELAAFEQKIQFAEADADPVALALNHYSAEAWRTAVFGHIAAARFAAWLRPYCDVQRVSAKGKPYAVARAAGYNVIAFDGPRLRALFGEQFCPVDYLMRDVLQRVLFYCDEMGQAPENFKLSTVAAWFGLPVDGAHDALCDVRLCAAVYRAMTEGW